VKDGPLKTATAIVGLLAGVVAAVYVLGGLTAALRLFFDHFHQDEVVSAVSQLPRETVIATALLGVVGPAAVAGLFAAMVYGLSDRPRPRGVYEKLSKEEWLARSAGSGRLGQALRRLSWLAIRLLPILHPRGPLRLPALTSEQEHTEDRLTAGSKRHVVGLFVFFLVVAAVGVLPALRHAVGEEETGSLLVPCVIAAVLTYGVVAAGWHTIRRVARRDWSRGEKALLAGLIWAAIAVIPMLMLSGTKSFVSAQVCTSSAQVPIKGKLIGESSSRVFLEEEFGEEASIVGLPTEQVTRSEYGDLSSTFSCPLTPGQQVRAKVAEDSLEGHGSPEEVKLATELRPRLLFDSHEPWRPIDAGTFVAERFGGGRTHEACDWLPAMHRSRCRPAELGALSPEIGAPDYLDIHGSDENGADFASSQRQCHTVTPPAVDCNAGRRAVIYYRRTTHEGRWYWDYWWFLRYNHYIGPFDDCNPVNCSNHEGDWEGITVITTPSRHPEIVGAIYAAHRNRVLANASEIPISGGRPLVFIALGTHASYPYRCVSSCQQYAKLGGTVRLPEGRHDGAVSWGGNDDGDCQRFECVRPLPEVGPENDLSLPLAGAWAGWPGLWGETCHKGCGWPLIQGSPRSPGLQIRFECPWAATDWALPARDGSGLSRSEPAGDAERLFAACRAQRGGERGL
jgi:hypothetical protein